MMTEPTIQLHRDAVTDFRIPDMEAVKKVWQWAEQSGIPNKRYNHVLTTVDQRRSDIAGKTMYRHRFVWHVPSEAMPVIKEHWARMGHNG